IIGSGLTNTAEALADEAGVAGRWLAHQAVPLDDGGALISRDVTERKLAEQALAEQARLDALTQLGNRRDFEERLHSARARSLRSGQTLALLYLDLDGFKGINDNFGHATGDQLLMGVAQRLQEC